MKKRKAQLSTFLIQKLVHRQMYHHKYNKIFEPLPLLSNVTY